MSNIQIFKNPEFGEIRAIEKDGQPWFVGIDTTKLLGYQNGSKAIADHVDEDDLTKRYPIIDNLGRSQETTLINESGLYSLVLSSKLPTAKKFKKWVTSEVLPSIRKHGAYMTDNTIEKALTDPDFLIKLATNLKEEKAARLEAESKVKIMKPKADFADHVATSNNSMLVREVAKIVSKGGIKIGERRLYEKLRQWGLVFKNSCEATQKAIENGYMEVTEGVRESSKGKFTFKTSKVTGKGQIYIVNKLKEEAI